MFQIAQDLALEGYILRSGGAKGADQAFELGAGTFKEIYTPDNVCDRALQIAAEVHPTGKGFFKLKPYTQRLLARNVYQVLGRTLDNPVDFVICWTPDGCENHSTRSKQTGGTGQAIALASMLDIPVYNLYNTTERRW